jgi:hypothetical protein
MNKLIMTFVALATLSGIALAGDFGQTGRNYDLRDSDTYNGKFATKRISFKQSNSFAVINSLPASDEALREQHRLDEKH